MFRWALILVPPLRWLRILRLSLGKVRVHPNVLIFGSRRQLICAEGVKLGSRVSIDPGESGKVLIDAGVWVASDVEVHTNSTVRIGEGTSIQRRSTVNGSVNIGRGCIIAPNVFISSGTHPFRAGAHLPIREQENRLSKTDRNLAQLDRPIWIQDDCWLGINVVICPGVTVGKGTVIGANSVINKNTPPYSVVAGCPANIVGRRLDWSPKPYIDVGLEEDHPYLLDANLVRKGSGYVVLLSSSSSLLAALSKPEFTYSISVEWQSQNEFYWIIGDKRVYQEPGLGRFIISSDEMKTEDGVVYCQISIENKLDLFSSIEIHKISVKKYHI